jgi:hypothetical protein
MTASITPETLAEYCDAHYKGGYKRFTALVERKPAWPKGHIAKELPCSRPWLNKLIELHEERKKLMEAK